MNNLMDIELLQTTHNISNMQTIHPVHKLECPCTEVMKDMDMIMGHGK